MIGWLSSGTSCHSNAAGVTELRVCGVLLLVTTLKTRISSTIHRVNHHLVQTTILLLFRHVAEYMQLARPHTTLDSRCCMLLCYDALLGASAADLSVFYNNEPRH